MKRNIVILLICMGIMMCTGCQKLPYVNEIPAAYDDTRWVSEEPYIWFECPFEGTSKYMYGKAMTPDGEVDIAVDFAWFEPRIYIYAVEEPELSIDTGIMETEPNIGDCMMTGVCEYSEEYCIVKLDEDAWFDQVGEIIIFKSEPLEDE